MFDAHVHLQDASLNSVLVEVLQYAVAAGVTGVCCCATGPLDWEAVKVLAAAQLPFVMVPAFGVHPWFVEGLPAEWRDQLADYLDSHPTAALGEIGVDGLRREIPAALQEMIFKEQLALAAHMHRPVVLHGARAWGRLLELLRPYVAELPGFIAHSFAGSAEILRQIVDMGGYISFSGSVCNPQAARVRHAAVAAPESHLLIETDTPDLLPRGAPPAAVGATGRPLNQPANLVHILNAVASLREISPISLADITAANARRILL